MRNLPNVPGMKLPPMDATEAMRIIANVTSNMSPNNPNVLNAIRAETVLFAIVKAARELIDTPVYDPQYMAERDKLRKALAGAP